MSYSMGFFLNSFFMTSYNVLVFYYYEVEIGLATALVGLSFAIFAVWNMINDPLTGYLTDKPMRWSKKYGLRTPWIISGVILTIISFYFLFALPDFGDVKSNPWPFFWYMVITTCLFDTFFSLYTTHYSGGFANIFRSKEERRKGSTIVMLFGVFGTFSCRVIIIPAFIVYGDPSSFPRFAVVSLIVLFICLILLLPGIHENEFVKNRYLKIYEFLETQKMPYFQFLKTTFKSKNFMTYLTVHALWTYSVVLGQISAFYMLKDVMGFDISVLMILGIVVIISYLPSLLIWTTIAKKMEHSKVYGISFILMGCSAIIGMWQTTLIEVIIKNIIQGIAGGAFGSVLWSIVGDSVDEANLSAGRHVEAGLIGIRNFITRSAFLVAGVVISGIHIATGYVPGADHQSDLALLGIRVHSALIPAIVTWIAAFLMLKVYDLKGEKKEAQMKALRRKGL
jgi:Na+/melibiose symporter-like transporter